MNIQRFTAATSREALAMARMVFGEGTLILSNRATENGVEVVATAEETLVELDRGAEANTNSNSNAQKMPGSMVRGTKPTHQEIASKVEDDATQLSMSTLSFQDYVRERMLRKRHEPSPTATATATVPAPSQPAKRPLPQREAPQERLSMLHEEERERPRSLHVEQENPRVQPTERFVDKNAFATNANNNKPPAVRKPAPPVLQSEEVSRSVVDELQAMKELIEDRFNTLTWMGQARQNPIQSNLMLKLIRAGYSPNLSRTILERMPEELSAAESVQWVIDVLERNLKTDAQNPAFEDGGIFGLIGATGVGKTTTAAKLAGLCARTHGPASVGLITLDTYRVGAHEQLRAYGKMLGVVAHLAHDRFALQDLLGLLSNKKMVLIDTTGLAPRDTRKREMMDLLDLPNVKRLLVLNAGSHGDTLDEAVCAFKSGNAQHAIFSKTDEAVKLGPAIDAAIRHQLVLCGITTGQRVPEDWESASAGKLVRTSMRTDGVSAYDPKINDLGFIYSQKTTQSTTQLMARGRFDA
ncbi:MAG: flagellar biosynthesis protein FlhF [Rhodoferax sp.]|nr:flagellar biosynthesis protein FlhF [Rhodoferax sp.]